MQLVTGDFWYLQPPHLQSFEGVDKNSETNLQDLAGEADVLVGDNDGDLMSACGVPLKLQAPLTALVLPLAEAGELRWSDIGEIRFGEGVLLLGGIT